ncbi:MAG TPA: heterodisulfide reductase-related iron-sulfur binding cluster [Bryobacteraceae bacterium]|nr:heterodisulfide reductase-related iron-sulfur binding cluster [Bryobacteraceae bacterium]
MAVSDAPRREDLDKCVHCGLCLNACPTYRELGVEMDSPRGRIYQMVQVANGAPITESYQAHIDLCLACRGCETACPSGVKYGRLIEAARADIEERTARPLMARISRKVVFDYLLPSRTLLRLAGAGLWIYQRCGIQRLVRASGILKKLGKLGDVESLTPSVESPSFFRNMGRVFPAQGERKHRVVLLSGCIANICFARLNEATVRVLQANGCEVTIHDGQTCCGALHVHAGLRDRARVLARKNIDALAGAGYDAILTNAGGCGSTLKEYDELLEQDPAYAERARQFVGLMKDVNEFLASIGLNPRMGEVREVVTYQDSCHLAHGQRVRSAPRELLRQVPGLTLKEMPMSDLCCGSAGIYNVVHTEMALALLEKKMGSANSTGATRIVTANPGCMLQLRAGVDRHGHGQRVSHVVEVLDEAYRAV